MKRLGKVFLWLAGFGILLWFCAESIYASDGDQIKTAYEKLLQYEVQIHEASTEQEFLDGFCTENATNGNVECFVMGMVRAGDQLDFSGYQNGLYQMVNADSEMSASRMQKAAVTELSITSESLLAQHAMERIGEDSIMSEIYGLMVSGRMGIARDRDLEKLLSKQLVDGGFAYTGDLGDVDVTAMTLQALCYYQDQETVATAIKEALLFLSENQLPQGDFASMGNANCESTAQVLLALEVLEIDWGHDERFLQNGNTVLDGLLRYQMENGAFVHALGGSENEMASSQAFYALGTIVDQDDKESVFETQKGILSVCLVILGIFLCILLRKRKKIRDFLLVLIACGILVICFVTPARKTPVIEKIEEGNVITVSMSIDCKAILSKKPDANSVVDFSEVIPADGVIYGTEQIQVLEGTTVFSLLQKVCEEKQIQLEYRSDSAYGSAYIEGLGYLSEFDFGDLSGWMYLVNGEFPSVGCGEYRLQDNDVVQWVYTAELGKDIGHD